MSGARVPPLLTVSPPGTPRANAGVLGAPGTTGVFGGDQLNQDLRIEQGQLVGV
jgi:Putative beta barrel porin-7 (BBP7)